MDALNESTEADLEINYAQEKNKIQEQISKASTTKRLLELLKGYVSMSISAQQQETSDSKRSVCDSRLLA